ncbi:MAG: glycosyltransferase family 39 protein [Bdellovibrionales bacterium]|nr:glycosyltransferase family 39 protein [Bdellovibrionales bacterium]
MRVSWFRYVNLCLSLSWLALVYFFFDRHPWPWPDEALYADIAQNFVESGTMGISFFKGYFTQIESHQHFYPPFYFLSLALLLIIFPLSLISLRAFSLFCLVGTIFWIWKALNRQFKPISFLGMSLLILFDPVVLRGSLVGRMDTLGVLLILGSLLTLHVAERDSKGKKKIYHLLLTGILGSLAFLTHPMAWTAPATLGIYSLWALYKKSLTIHEVLLIASSGLIASMPYVVWVALDKAYFFEQFQAQVARKAFVSPKSISEGMSSYEVLFKQYSLIKPAGIFLAVLSWSGLIWFSLKDFKALKFVIAHLIAVCLASYSREMWYPLYFILTGSIGLLYLLDRCKPQVSSFLILSLLIIFSYSHLKKIEELRGFNYGLYCAEIVKMVGAEQRVFLASVPDPYFCFASKKISFGQFIPGAIPVNVEKAFKKFDEYKVFIGGEDWFGEHLKEYLTERAGQFKKQEGHFAGFPFKVWKRE